MNIQCKKKIAANLVAIFDFLIDCLYSIQIYIRYVDILSVDIIGMKEVGGKDVCGKH